MNKKIVDIQKKLDKLGIKHEIVYHPPIKSVEEGLKYLGIEAADGVSTLILNVDGRFYAVFRRDDHRLDLDKVKQVLKADKVRLASDDEVLQTTGAKKGATPLLSGLPTIMDETVLEREFVYGGTGSFEHDLKIRPKELKKITGALLADVIKHRRVFSGSRPTGRLHLGNYLGGIKGYIALQERGDLDCIYSVVDIHGLFSKYDPETFQEGIRNVVLDYLGAGLDPKKCHLMIQSQVPEHLELAYLFASIYPVSRLEQLPTYKTKKKEQADNVNLGLFSYPILMAADILVYKAELVPVGIDQEPHIELTREVARKFNSMFSPLFPEPQRYASRVDTVMGLTGEGKMSKSVEGSYILLTDDLETIKARLAKVPTDIGKGEKIPTEGGVAMLLQLAGLFMGDEVRKSFEKKYVSEGIRYGDMKVELSEAIYKDLQPIQERRAYFENHPEEVDRILEEGREYCSKIACATLQEVKAAMGLL